MKLRYKKRVNTNHKIGSIHIAKIEGHIEADSVCSQATEDFIVHLMEDTNLCALHAKRVTISKTLDLYSLACPLFSTY